MTRDVDRILERLRDRPALLLGTATITRLDAYVAGFADGDGARANAIRAEFLAFTDFVARRYRRSAPAGWAAILLAEHFGDETAALKQFLSDFDAFRAGEDPEADLRLAEALLSTLLHDQARWRAEIPDFDGLLARFAPHLRALLMAGGGDIRLPLAEIEWAAETDQGLARVVAEARRRAGEGRDASSRKDV